MPGIFRLYIKNLGYKLQEDAFSGHLSIPLTGKYSVPDLGIIKRVCFVNGLPLDMIQDDVEPFRIMRPQRLSLSYHKNTPITNSGFYPNETVSSEKVAKKYSVDVRNLASLIAKDYSQVLKG